MSADTPFSDDYVANLLKKDARDSSVRYSALGLQAFLPQRPSSNAPKPNTRFLRNIIRDTDNHNAALLAKEAQEARARLRALREGEPRSKHEHRSSASDYAENKRKRMEVAESESNIRRSSEKSSSARIRHQRSRRDEVKRDGHDDSDREHSRHPHRHNSREHRRRHRSRSREGHSSQRSARDSHRHLRRHHRSSRSRSPHGERVSQHRRSHRPRSVSYSPERHNDSAPSRSKRANFSPKIGMGTSKSKRSPSLTSDSDPLEAIIGPQPPTAEPKVRVRGRGALSSSSGIDNRFASGYDPSTDVQPNVEDEDDWDQALEALRDRQRWKQSGADRLRAAGFTEEEVDNWKKGGERSEADVRWARRGEGREWDRGKVVDAEGDIDLKPEWGRLKDT
ncbi:hypothetical protein L228DRAFT_285173 [Xylona heveae TC161]|uniref:Uncharacterized protein n=1 Tax=Xylona heveae (strain CBS 132557 / TC161) TaxID=1328760 RepID=A0A165AHA1_XYLHT|nr:hypothetical protein L228DRAFT_285173 [Xylona heveae TC161]KZF20471.1 hypothetical protein L228DRAFT_285173 [Xylona heveae TC161]